MFEPICVKVFTGNEYFKPYQLQIWILDKC